MFKLNPNEFLDRLEQKDKEFIEITEKQQEEYFKRIDKIIHENNKTSRLRCIGITIIVVIYIIAYFSTPYLTRNYNNVENVNGNVATFQEGSEK